MGLGKRLHYLLMISQAVHNFVTVIVYVSAMDTSDMDHNSCHMPPTLLVCVLYMPCSGEDACAYICPNMVKISVQSSPCGFHVIVNACALVAV